MDTQEEVSESTMDIEIPSNIETNISEKNAELGAHTVTFTIKLSEKFEADMREYIEKEGECTRYISETIKHKLEEKGFYNPRFQVIDGQDATDLLRKNNFEQDISDESVLLVFNLPKPLSKYWWKGYVADDPRNTHSMVIEWGKIYAHTIRVIRDGIDHSQENYPPLYIRRINAHAQHDSDNYYYIWEVSNKPIQTGDLEEDDIAYYYMSPATLAKILNIPDDIGTKA